MVDLDLFQGSIKISFGFYNLRIPTLIKDL